MSILDQIANPYNPRTIEHFIAGRREKQRFESAEQEKLAKQLEYRESVKEAQHNQFIRTIEKSKTFSRQVAQDLDSISTEADYRRMLDKYEKLNLDTSMLKAPNGHYLPLDNAKPILRDIKQSALESVDYQQKLQIADEVSRQQNRRRKLEVRLNSTAKPKTRRTLQNEINEIDDRIERLTAMPLASSSISGFSRPGPTKDQIKIAKKETKELLSRKVPGEEKETFSASLGDLGNVDEAGTDANFIASVMAEVPNTLARKYAKQNISINDARVRNTIKDIAAKSLTDRRIDFSFLGIDIGKTSLPFKQDIKLDREAFLKELEKTYDLTPVELTNIGTSVPEQAEEATWEITEVEEP